MKISRRDLSSLLTAMIPAANAAQEKSVANPDVPQLQGKLYKLHDLPWHASANGATRAKAMFNGFTSRGQRVTMHATELAANQQPHPAARQPHEEILIVQQGTLACTINGESATLGPGDVLYSAYNDLKDWKNAGETPAVYYVISLEEHK